MNLNIQIYQIMNTFFDLKNKTILLTGASGFIEKKFQKH